MKNNKIVLAVGAALLILGIGAFYLWQSSEAEKIRHSIEGKRWRKKVFYRDNHICQKTKVRGCNLVAHHIQNFADFPELRFDVDNGITLSVDSHIQFHRIYGKKNNTKEQLEEYLQSNL